MLEFIYQRPKKKVNLIKEFKYFFFFPPNNLLGSSSLATRDNWFTAPLHSLTREDLI